VTDWPVFWATVGLGFATVGVAIMALFGDAVRDWWFRPTLELNIAETCGELARIGSGPMSRWFHVQVSNSHRRKPFHDVAVYLLTIEQYSEADGWYGSWRGRAQLQWRGEEPRHVGQYFYMKTVGPSWEADLFHVRDNDTRVHLNPPVVPSALRLLWPSEAGLPVKLRLTVQARANETETNQLVFEVEWNGNWDQNVSANRVVFKQITFPAQLSGDGWTRLRRCVQQLLD